MQSSGGEKNLDYAKNRKKSLHGWKNRWCDKRSPRWTPHTAEGLVSQEKEFAFHSKCTGQPLTV